MRHILEGFHKMPDGGQPKCQVTLFERNLTSKSLQIAVFLQIEECHITWDYVTISPNVK